jgi:hypothetical protein
LIKPNKEDRKMGLGKLNVFISGIDDPCGLDDAEWAINIYDCNGAVLDWCGKKYGFLVRKCGHFGIPIPPGCYYIKAWRVSRSTIAYPVAFTDAAIVQVRCEETTCVKLFASSLHRSGYTFVKALSHLTKEKVIKPEMAKDAERAIRLVLAKLPRPKKEFELGHLDEIEKLVRKRKPKRRK